MYSIYQFGRMIADKVRMDRYVNALRMAVNPGSIVVDIGTGTGIFAMLACRMGAERVYAIEPNDSIIVAEKLSRANGFNERIKFFQLDSREVELPEKADVVISDLRGVLPLFNHHIPSVVDARQRFLKEGGTLIPQVDSLWAAVVEAPDEFEKFTTPWNENNFDMNLEAAHEILTNTWFNTAVKPDQLLTTPTCWHELDYNKVQDANIASSFEMAITKPGIGTGLVLWFDAIILDDITFSNAPGATNSPRDIYGMAYFPWPTPLEINPDDKIKLNIKANLAGDDYLWSWETDIFTQGKSRVSFRQSTFQSIPISLERLRKRSSEFIPTLSDDGIIACKVLEYFGQQKNLESIAEKLVLTYPEKFRNKEDAMHLVRELSTQYAT